MNRVNTVSLRGGRGFTLIEALIGLVILSVGLLSVVALQTELISSTGQTKARTEAMQIAEREMEALRNFIIRETQTGIHTFDDIATAALPDEVGTNANFEVGREVDSVGGDPDLLQVSVEVAWTDPKDGDLSVDLESFIGWDDVSAGARSAATEAIEPGSLLSPPTGRARQGGRVYDDVPDGADPVGDGFDAYIYDAPDGLTELIDSAGRVMLTIDSGEAFSSVSGTFYTTQNNVDAGTTQVTASDASACLQTGLDAQGNLSQEGNFYYYRYRCWVGPAWYGNVGVVRSGGAHNNDRTCVGDPAVTTPSATFDSRHPVMSAVRVYRGFKDVGMDDPQSVGIGVNPAYDDLADPNAYTPQDYTGHDFMLHRFGGNNMDNDGCVEVMASSTFDSSPAENFDGNAGYGFCLSKQWDPDYCPAVMDPPDPVTTTTIVELDLQGFGPPKPQEDAFETIGYPAEMDGQGCTLDNQGQLECLVARTGWSGVSWDGDLTFFLNQDVTLCEPLNDYGGFASNIDVSGNVISFTDIPATELVVTIGATIAAPGEVCPP